MRVPLARRGARARGTEGKALASGLRGLVGGGQGGKRLSGCLTADAAGLAARGGTLKAWREGR